MTVTVPPPARPERQRNARGEGSKLRGEILDAAGQLLETGQALSLRSIARGAGIAAPSIYRHFPDVDAVMAALAERAFEVLTAELALRRDEVDGAVTRLVAICSTYLRYAHEHPHAYRLMFGDVWNATVALEAHPEEADRFRALGGNAWALLIDAVQACVDEGASSSVDPVQDATALWIGLHGWAQLRETAKLFPWPPHVETTLVSTLARLREPA